MNLNDRNEPLNQKAPPKMGKVAVENYRKDHYYRKIVNSFAEILGSGKVISPISVFISIGLLKQANIDNWKMGRIPYLEKVIECNLSKASRILRIISFHAHDLDMKRSLTVYKRKVKGKTVLLKFTKTGDMRLEKAYSTHFIYTRKEVLHRSDGLV
jgi:hypothetical protein